MAVFSASARSYHIVVSITCILILQDRCLAERSEASSNLRGKEDGYVTIIKPLPTKLNMPLAAAVFIPDVGIAAARYATLAEQLQRDTAMYLFVALVDFPSQNPTASGEFHPLMTTALSDLDQMGFNKTSARLLYVFGHGTGSFPLQDWAIEYVANQRKTKPLPAPLKGVVLLGSFLQRKHRNITYPTGVLTMAGDLDGVTRVTRIAESYYHLILHPSFGPINYGFPHVVLQGVSHMQFASGPPSPTAQELDLKPELPDANATRAMADIAAAFLELKFSEGVPTADKIQRKTVLDSAVQSTSTFIMPLVMSMELEAYHNFHLPCYDKNAGSKCSKASPWVEKAQSLMCNVSYRSASVKDHNILWPINKVFPHDYLPDIHNKCNEPAHCVLNTTSVVENVYDNVDEADVSLSPVTALQQEAKLSSRQRCYEHAGITPADFNTTEGGSLCARINKVAYEDALKAANPGVKERFLRSGQKMTMAADKETAIFPVWSLEPLMIDTTGKDAVVTSWASKYPTSNPIPLVSGLHFCKLLSPARAMEWVYIDGLRKYNSLPTQT